MAVARYPVEHFYHGQPLNDGRPASRSHLLAASSEITPELVKAVIERVTLPPLPNAPKTAWALVRGNRQLPFVMVQTQRGRAGQVTSHYILMPSDVLRAIGGNLRALMKLVEDEMPTYTATGETLPQLEILQPEPESTDQQVDDILNLMTMTHNRLDVMESLLAAIVRGVQIIVQGAPVDLEERVDFMSGIMALLPPSVRFAVTFATHSLPTTEIDVQIRFYSDDPTPRETLVYNWQTGELSGQQVEDDYSHFVISQLRLDTSLVIEQTRALTTATGWRMRQGDRLGEALAYGSYRLKLDTALRNNQPVDKDDAAKVLTEDPTLDDSLRVIYGKHLLTLSLAMDDVQYADPLIQFFFSNPELENTAYQQMLDALDQQQAATVYRMAARWLAGTKMAESEKWVAIAHRAAITHVEALTKNRQLDALNYFVEDLLQTTAAVHLEQIIGRLVEKMLPLTPQDATLAENIFLLSTAYMDTPRFRRLLELKPFISQLNPQIAQVLAYLSGRDAHEPTPGLVASAARTFGEQWEPLVLVRFAELLRQMGRFDLLDETTLHGVAQLATSPYAASHYERLLFISARPGERELTLLGAKAARYLLQIRLALSDYPELATQMIQQSATLYPGDLQIEYIKTVEQVFAETAISPQQVTAAITEINHYGIKSAPLLMASIGALQNRPHTAELDALAEQIADTLVEEPQLVNVIPTESILALLQYHVESSNVQNTIHAAELIAAAAAAHSEEGLRITAQIYRMMAEDRTTRAAALRILQTYVRSVDDRNARQAIAYYGRELGNNLRNALEAVYLVKQVMSGRDLATYAQAVQRTVTFLQDAAATYNERSLPTADDLTLRLDTMRDSLSREERRVFTKALLSFARGIVGLYQQYRSRRSPAANRLLSGTADPVSGIDVLRVIAGYFSDGKLNELKLRTSLPNPLGERTRKFLYDEVLAGSEVLSGILRATEAPLEIKAEHIRDAVANLVRDLSEEEQREVRRILAVELQKLAALIEMIAEKGDPKALEEGALGSRIDDGRHRPRSALEFMRFIYGYHLTKG